MNTVVEALGWTLLHFLWQGALIGALLGLFLAVVRHRPPVRYLVACLALGAMVLAVAFTLLAQLQTQRLHAATPAPASQEEPEPVVVKQTVLSFDQCLLVHSVENVDGPNTFADHVLPDRGMACRPAHVAVEIPSIPLPFSDRDPPPASGPAGAEELQRAASPLLAWLVAAWSVGVAFLSLRFLLACGTVRRLPALGGGPADPSLTACVRKLAARLGVTRPVSVLRSTAVIVPTVVGWLRPVILLPVASVAGLSRPQLEAVLAHELAHICRHDFLVNLLQHAVETALFFHPAVWWVSHRIREEREHCCDDIARDLCGGSLDYARALAALETTRGDRFALGVAADGGSLLARIRRLAGAENGRRGPLLLASLLVLAAAIAVPLALPSGNESARLADTAHPAKSEKILPLPSSEALRGLRHLSGKRTEAGIPFDDFTDLASSLSDEDLVALAEEIGLDRLDDYAEWTRAALFAEWAERDLEAALAFFNRKRSPLAGDQGILYALYRGSRPDDPGEALAYLRSLHDDPRFRRSNEGRYPLAHHGADWVRTAYRRLFAELSAADPEVAFRQLPGQDPAPEEPLNHNRLSSSNHSYVEMLDGFFSGLPDSTAIEHYIQRLGVTGEPGTEMIAIRIAAAWMARDFDAALAWARPQEDLTTFNPTGAAVLIGGVRENAVNHWARAHPEQALAAAQGGALPPARIIQVTSGALSGNPHLAPEIAAFLNSFPAELHAHPARAGIFPSAMRETSSNRGDDRFPEPGRTNVAPGYHARYQSFQAALQDPGFSPDRRAQLQAVLDNHFRSALATARND